MVWLVVGLVLGAFYGTVLAFMFLAPDDDD